MEPKIQVVIPSRHRAETVAKAARLFHDPIVCVDESEVEDYRKTVPQLKILAHPSEVNVLQRIRQWILDHVKADVIFQCDDDVHNVYAMAGYRVRELKKPDDIYQIIRNAALNSRDAGTCYFFFAHVRNPIQFHAYDPIRFVSPPVGCAQGIWREQFNREIRFDPGVQKCALDATLRILAHPRFRIVWCDTRFCFQPKTHLSAAGGLSGLRTADGVAKDDELLRKRFGSAIWIRHDKKHRNNNRGVSPTVSIKIYVDR